MRSEADEIIATTKVDTKFIHIHTHKSTDIFIRHLHNIIQNNRYRNLRITFFTLVAHHIKIGDVYLDRKFVLNLDNNEITQIHIHARTLYSHTHHVGRIYTKITC